MRHSALILGLLGLLAAASLGGAYMVLVGATPPAEPPPPRLFVQLDEEALARIATIRITYGLGLAGVQRLTIARASQGGFTIAEYDDYPANAGALTRMLAALQRLAPVARKTARPDWHGRLGLVAPDELGQAIQLEIWDGDGRELAGLLIGKKQESEGVRALEGARAETLTEESFYVRRLNEAQSFLVRSAWRVPRAPEDWLSQTLPWFSRAEVQRISLRRAGGAEQVFARTAPDLPFAAAAGAAETLSLAEAETLLAALRRLQVRRVARAQPDEPPATAQLLLESFDGEQLTLALRADGPLSQLRFAASGSARARQWQARYHPWIYVFQPETLAPLFLPTR